MDMDMDLDLATLTKRSCCAAALPHRTRDVLYCRFCGFRTCSVHAHVGPRGEWRCLHCFEASAVVLSQHRIELVGSRPAPANVAVHVLLVIHGLHICGAARHCLELLEVFNSIGALTSVLAPFGGGRWADRFLAAAHDVTLLFNPSTSGAEIEDFEWHATRRILSLHYDHAIAWSLGGARLDAETYAHFHTDPEFEFYTRHTLVRAGLASRKLFFPSEATRRSYRALLPVEPTWWSAKSCLLPNSTPRAFDGPTGREHRDTGTDSLNVAIVSRLDQDKISPHFLLDALRTLLDVRQNCRVLIAGYGLLGSDLRALVARSGLDPYVEFLGWVDDIESVYRWAHVVFLPSHSETMPYAVMEAVAHGCGVATPRLGHFAMDTKHQLIHTFEPRNADDAVTAVLDADTGRAILHGPADLRFGWQRWRDKVLDAYELTEHGHD